MANTGCKHYVLSIAFLMIIYSAGLTQVAIELGRKERPQFTEAFLRVPTKANLRMFKEDLESNCWLAHKLCPWMRYMLFAALSDAGDKALLGRAGWLFYKPAVQYLIEPWSADADNDQGNIFSVIISFHAQLTEREIKLLLVPVPDKASVYPEMLVSGAGRIEQPVNSKTLEIISKLRQAGIEVVDLFEVFSQAGAGKLPEDITRYYLSQDTHWSPEGMRLAAKTVAKKILDSGWSKKRAIEYDLKPVTIERYGDILTMMQVPQIERLFEPEQLNCTQVVRAGSGQLYRDDPNSEILIIGDSFLRIYSGDEPHSGGFIEHLAYELGFGLISLVNDGGASTLVRQELSRKPALLTNKKLVIWEFAERDIRFGIEGWQHVPLPKPVLETATPLIKTREAD